MSNNKDIPHDILGLIKELESIDEKLGKSKNATQATLEDGREMMFYTIIDPELLKRRAEILKELEKYQDGRRDK